MFSFHVFLFVLDVYDAWVQIEGGLCLCVCPCLVLQVGLFCATSGENEGSFVGVSGSLPSTKCVCFGLLFWFTPSVKSSCVCEVRWAWLSPCLQVGGYVGRLAAVRCYTSTSVHDSQSSEYEGETH